MQRVGILGGTFDPPHMGHLILAEYTQEALKLDAILFVPAGDHPFKGDHTRTSVEHRLAMIEMAIAGNDKFRLSRADIDREGPHYSADTVRIIQEEYPDAQLYFVMGGDNLRSLPSWTRARELYEFCRLAVMKRADEDIAPDMHDDVLPALSEHVDIIDVPLLSIWLSSTHVIERIAKHQTVRYLVPNHILDYIEENGLYTS